MGQIDDLKRVLVTACRVLANQGLTDAFGHISVRIPGSNRFFIPAFTSLALVQESDLLILIWREK